MDRQAIMDQVNRHKGNSVIAQSEGRLWDSLFEECMYFHCERQLKGTQGKDVPIQAMLTLGFPMIRIGFSPSMKKECTSAVIAWSMEDGTEEKLKEILENYKNTALKRF